MRKGKKRHDQERRERGREGKSRRVERIGSRREEKERRVEGGNERGTAQAGRSDLTKGWVPLLDSYT